MTGHDPTSESASTSLSVLIPNYNYARYIGLTIDSVLKQASADTEIVVTDNASTDSSVEVVRAYDDDRVRLSVNPCNVGFAANLSVRPCWLVAAEFAVVRDRLNDWRSRRTSP